MSRIIEMMHPLIALESQERVPQYLHRDNLHPRRMRDRQCSPHVSRRLVQNFLARFWARSCIFRGSTLPVFLLHLRRFG